MGHPTMLTPLNYQVLIGRVQVCLHLSIFCLSYSDLFSYNCRWNHALKNSTSLCGNEQQDHDLCSTVYWPHRRVLCL